MRAAIVLAACLAFRAVAADLPVYGYQVVHAFPHDKSAFTEGLFYLNGFLYESTGRKGESSVRKVKLETGEVLQSHQLQDEYFGEGIVPWKDKIYQLTWQTEVGFAYDQASLTPKSTFPYPGEGWAFTTDGEPVKDLNELEWVKGEIFANVWETDRIARIDPKSGRVTGWIDLTGLLPTNLVDQEHADENVLNGIAYDAAHDRLFVTGKCWPKLYEIKLVRKR